MAELNLIGNQDLGGIPIMPLEAPVDWLAKTHQNVNAALDLSEKVKGVGLKNAQRKTAFAENELKAQQTIQAQQLLSNLQKKLPPNATALDWEMAQFHLKTYGFVPEKDGIIDMQQMRTNLDGLRAVTKLSAEVAAASKGNRKVETVVGPDGLTHFYVIDLDTGERVESGRGVPTLSKTGSEFEKPPQGVAEKEYDSLKQINGVVPRLEELYSRLDELAQKKKVGPLTGELREMFNIWNADYKDIETRINQLSIELASRGVISENPRATETMIKRFKEMLPGMANTPDQARNRFNLLKESFKDNAATIAGSLVRAKQDPANVQAYLGGIFTPEEQEQVLAGTSPRQHRATAPATEKPATQAPNTLRPNPADNGKTWIHRNSLTGEETTISHEDAAIMDGQHQGVLPGGPPQVPIIPIHPGIQFPSLQPGGALPFDSWSTGASPSSLGTDWWKLPINPQP